MSSLSERDKMIAGQSYDPADPELTADRLRARTLCHEFNSQSPEAMTKAASTLAELMHVDPTATINAPFRCDYGYNIHIGQNSYLNCD